MSDEDQTCFHCLTCEDEGWYMTEMSRAEVLVRACDCRSRDKVLGMGERMREHVVAWFADYRKKRDDRSS